MIREELNTIPAIADAIADQIENLEGSLKELQEIANEARKAFSPGQARVLLGKVDGVVSRHSLFYLTPRGATTCAAQGLGETMDMLLELLREQIDPDQ